MRYRMFVWTLAGVAVAAGVYVGVAKPQVADFIDDKLNSIQVAKPPVGNITPARDLTGAWDSSLRGKGFQLYGEFRAADTVTKAYEEGDIELYIDRIEGNTAYARMRFYNVTAWAQTTGPEGTVTLPKSALPDTGLKETPIRITGSALDFGSFSIAGATGTMQGSFTTDIITARLSTAFPPYGDIKGEVHLSRRRE